MRKYRAGIIFFALQIVLIFLQLYKKTYFIALGFDKQRSCKRKEDLILLKNSLQQKLMILQNKASVKKYAKKNLCMQTIRREQIDGL